MKKKTKSRKTASRKTKARKPAKRKTAGASAARGRGRRAAAKRPAPKARRRKPSAKRPRKAAAKRKPPKKTARTATGERPRARVERSWKRGLGAEAGGQSGDTEGIRRSEDVDSESVEELLEEGQSWEAGIVSGVENADDEEGEVRTREVPEDDVPEEYRDKD